ncbi:MAG: hypothetical protein AAF657_07220 [Acidobacteriota bacterium]
MKISSLLLILALTLVPQIAAAQDEVPAPRPRSLTSRAYAAALAPVPDAVNRKTYSFQVSLLLADTTNGVEFEGLSKNAQKALEDLRDFLPFKSYRLLDFAWLRTSHRSSARVQGPEGKTYELKLQLGLEPNEDSDRLFVAGFDLSDTSRDPEPTNAPLIRRQRSLISTSFGMQEGETVVVGTSRLEGDQRALVVLLTAVPTSLSGN